MKLSIYLRVTQLPCAEQKIGMNLPKVSDQDYINFMITTLKVCRGLTTYQFLLTGQRR